MTCAAVCKDWLYRSRSIQFKSLDFTPRHTWNRLSLLMDLLSSPHATIAPHVRQIVVPLHGNDWLIPFARIGQLHALRSVILHSLDCISLIPAKEVVSVLGSLTELRSLRLAHFGISSYTQLQDVVVACPRLERLYLEDLYISLSVIQPYVSTRPSPCPPGLHLFSVSDIPFDQAFFGWVSRPSQLRSICISFAHVLYDGPELSILLRDQGSALRHLCIIDCLPTIRYPRPSEFPMPFELCHWTYTVTLKPLKMRTSTSDTTIGLRCCHY